MKSASNNSNPTICLHVFGPRLPARSPHNPCPSERYHLAGNDGMILAKIYFPDIAGDFPSKKLPFGGQKGSVRSL